MSSASPSSQCGLRVQVAPPAGASAPTSPSSGCSCGELLAPRPDRDVGLLATDRDVGVGRVRDAQEQVVELAPRSRPASASSVAIRSPAAVDAARRSATSGPSGAAPPLIASPIRFDAALRSALSASLSPSRRAALGVERERAVDERRVLALVDRAVADRRPARRAGAAGRRSCRSSDRPSPPAASRSRSTHERRIEAGQQPAGARPVRPTEEREVDARRTPGRPAGPASVAAAKIARLPRVAADRRRRARPRRRAPPRNARWSSSRSAASAGSAS